MTIPPFFRDSRGAGSLRISLHRPPWDEPRERLLLSAETGTSRSGESTRASPLPWTMMSGPPTWSGATALREDRQAGGLPPRMQSGTPNTSLGWHVLPRY
jgi:hypothetical protein